MTTEHEIDILMARIEAKVDRMLVELEDVHAAIRRLIAILRHRLEATAR